MPCSTDPNDACVIAPVRRYAYSAGHNVTLLGKSVHENGQIMLTRNLFSYLGSMLVSLYYPSAAAGVPVRDFAASWIQQVGRGSGADGYSGSGSVLSAK